MDPAAPPPSTVPRPCALPPLWLSLTVLAVIALAALVTWRMGPLSTVPMAKGDEPMAVASPLPVAKTPAPQPQGQPPVLPDPPWTPPRPAPNSLEAQAFALVYPEVATVKPDDSMDARLRFWPVSLHRLDDDTYVLLSVAQILSVGELPGDQLCHPCQGFYSIAYLTRRPKLKLQGVPFIGRGSKGGWGQPPELELLENLGPRPMVLVRQRLYDHGFQSGIRDPGRAWTDEFKGLHRVRPVRPVIWRCGQRRALHYRRYDPAPEPGEILRHPLQGQFQARLHLPAVRHSL